MTGCDAVQLFPSLRAAESGKAVRDATINIITNTDFRVEGLDFKEIAKYVRMNLNDKEIKDRIQAVYGDGFDQQSPTVVS